MNQAKVSHLKKGDEVICLSGSFKGKNGKVLAVKQVKQLVQVDGIGLSKRHTKPSQKDPKGGVVEKLRWWPACKFSVVNKSKAKEK